MKYLCLGYYDAAKFEALPKPELEALVRKCKDHDQELRKTGKMKVLGSLSAPQEWKSIRPRRGKPSVIDGPFTEAKELVGAFFIIEATDMAEAVAIASKHPAAHLGADVGWGVEVRACEMYEQA